MKMKSLAMLVMSGLLASSVAYVAPAMADDTADQSTQSSDQSQNSNDSSAASTDANAPSSDSSNSSGDNASPDTTSGDDDY